MPHAPNPAAAPPPASADPVELLAWMVRYDTVSTPISGRPRAEAALSEAIAQWAEPRGLAVRRLPVAESFADNLLLTLPERAGRPWLLLDSHLDTVSTEGMRIDPWAAEVRDGRLFGRGACDTKASAAAMLAAVARCAADDPPNRPWNAALLLSVNEEAGMHGIRAFVQQSLPALGLRPALAVVGEPTGLQLVAAHNGVTSVELVTTGVAAHSSEPSRGRSAISAMARAILAFEQLYLPTLDRWDPLTGRAQASINTLRGGSARNIIPDRCEAVIDRRLLPGESPEAELDAMRQCLAPLAEQDPGFDARFTLVGTNPPLPRAEDAALRPVSEALSAAGLDPAPRGVAFATHAGVLAEAGVPSVVLGPGAIAQAHTADEWVELDQVRRAAGVYHDLLTRPAAPDASP